MTTRNLIVKRGKEYLRAEPNYRRVPLSGGLVAVFARAGTGQGHRIVSMTPSFKTRRCTIRYPNRLIVGSMIYPFKGQSAAGVRQTDENYTAAIDDLEDQIAKLRRQWQELKAEAYNHGRSITLTEARAWNRRAEL